MMMHGESIKVTTATMHDEQQQQQQSIEEEIPTATNDEEAGTMASKNNSNNNNDIELQSNKVDSSTIQRNSCRRDSDEKSTKFHRIVAFIKPVILIVCFLLLLLSNANQIYTIVTWNSKKQCYTSRVNEAKQFAPFLWLTSWVLWLSTIFYVWYMNLYFKSRKREQQQPPHPNQEMMKSFSFRCFFQIILCLSVATIIGYSVGLFVEPPTTDKDKCLVISDSVVDRAQPAAKFWLVMDRIFNLTAHYLCGIFLFVLYWKGEVLYDIKFPVAAFLGLLFSIILGLAHTFLAPVYADDNLWLHGFFMYMGTLLLHCLFYWPPARWTMNKTTGYCCWVDERQIKAIILMGIVLSGTVCLHVFVDWGIWVFVVLSVVFLLHIFFLVARSHGSTTELQSPNTSSNNIENDDVEKCAYDDDWLPFISLLASAKDEESVIENLVRQLDNIEYPKHRYELLVVDDNSSDSTYSILCELHTEYPQLRLHQRNEGSTGGKSGALNEALKLVHPDSSIIGVLDADAIMDPTLLRSIAQIFQHEDDKNGLTAIQVRKRISNEEDNLLTKCQQYEMYFDSFLQQQRGAVSGIGDLRGNGMFVRRNALQEVHGWNEETVTDDLDLSFRLQLHGHGIKNLFLEATVQEEGVTTVSQLWHQRNRWAEGWYQRFLDYGHQIASGRLGLYKTLDVLLFFLVQHVVSMVVLPDLVLAFYFHRIPLTTPLTSATFVFFLLTCFISIWKVECTKEPERRRSTWKIGFWALATGIYVCHWPVVYVLVEFRMCLFPKRLKWVKTPRQDSKRTKDDDDNAKW